jgi:hypothetical protein
MNGPVPNYDMRKDHQTAAIVATSARIRPTYTLP